MHLVSITEAASPPMEDGSKATVAEATAPEVTVGGLILTAAAVVVTTGANPSMEAMANEAEATEVKSDAAEC